MLANYEDEDIIEGHVHLEMCILASILIHCRVVKILWWRHYKFTMIALSSEGVENKRINNFLTYYLRDRPHAIFKLNYY